MATENKRIQLRRGTSSALSAVNEVPLAGEIVLETDTGKMKIGDGVTNYNDLGYINSSDNSNLTHETWSLTLDDENETEITKEVVLWTAMNDDDNDNGEPEQTNEVEP